MVNAWLDNNYRGIFTIATSGGKTLAAIVSANLSPKNMLIVVVVPGTDLAEQWKEEIRDYDPKADITICDHDYDWKNDTTIKLNKFLIGNDSSNLAARNYLIVTNDTASGDVFQENFRYVNPDNVIIIADEVHHVGAPTYRKVLDLDSTRRIGLSATYSRQWDEVGTDSIVNYFGKGLDIAGYTISEGIKDGRLCKYSYHPFFSKLFLSFHKNIPS